MLPQCKRSYLSGLLLWGTNLCKYSTRRLTLFYGSSGFLFVVVINKVGRFLGCGGGDGDGGFCGCWMDVFG